MNTGLDTDRLFKDKLAEGTLAYKLQYDLGKIGIDCVPKEFDFDKMYAE